MDYGLIFLILLIFILISILERKSKNRNKNGFDESNYDNINITLTDDEDDFKIKNSTRNLEYDKTKNNSLYKIESDIERKIKENDPYFNVQELVDWVEDIFKEIYYQIDNGNIEKLSAIFEDDYYNRIKDNMNIRNKIGIINEIDNVNVEFVKVTDYAISDDNKYEYITVALTTILSNQKHEKYWSIIYNIFMKRSLTYKEGNNEISIENFKCPNCGAKMKINNNISSCEYCGQQYIVSFGDWKIYNITKE